MRLKETIQEQREAEERMVEADNTKQQAEERESDLDRRVVESEQRQQQAERTLREALHRSQIAENRLAVETQRRMEAQELNRQLEERLERHQCGDDVFWRVERDEIQLFQEELGRGAWCKVMVAEFRGLQVAAKCLHSTIISNHNRQLFMREMNISAKLRHPNLVQFIGATVEGKPVILTELMTASLRGILEQGPFQLQQITSARTISMW
jgi:serine/threonine protein kinase